MGQGISTSQFIVFGKKHFTKTGYEKAVKSYSFPVQTKAAISVAGEGSDGVDLDGKVVVVSGANSGIGKELATYAAAKGAKLYMVCRSEERAKSAKQDIVDLTSSDKVEIVLADLGELSQVRRAAETLQSKENKIDCLVCNAGVLLNERQETSDDNEVTYATHLLGGSYLLSTLLIPQLKAAGEDSRVIFVSSGGMYNTKFPAWDIATSKSTKEKYNGQFSYAYAKRGQVLLAERYTRDYPEIAWVSCHPGWSSTPAVDMAYGSNKKLFEPFRTPWEGAEGIAWLMSTKRENIESGEFYLDRSPQTKHLAGLFMTEGSYTKNTEAEVDSMMAHLKEDAGL